MKESTIISMQRDVETLKKVATNAIKQLEYQQNLLGGVMAALELMPEYQEALKQIIEKAKEETIKEAPKTELE